MTRPEGYDLLLRAGHGLTTLVTDAETRGAETVVLPLATARSVRDCLREVVRVAMRETIAPGPAAATAEAPEAA